MHPISELRMKGQNDLRTVRVRVLTYDSNTSVPPHCRQARVVAVLLYLPEEIFLHGSELLILLVKVSTMNQNEEGPCFCDNSEVGPPLSPNNDAVEKVFSNTLVSRFFVVH